MSTQNIINSNNLPTEEVVANALSEYSVDLMKHIRFDIGKVCITKIRHLLRLERLHCGSFCYLDEEQTAEIRADLIRSSIRKIGEI